MFKEGENITVWFSCGAASAVAAKKIIELYGDKANIPIVNNPVIEEYADNRRFLNDVQNWLGKEIKTASNSKFPNCSAVEIWDKEKYMSGTKGATCTRILKKEARYQWELTHKIDWHVIGFTADEESRSDNFIKGERDNTIPVLVSESITKKDCFSIIQDAGILLPESYRKGFPNANCIGCVKATSPTYWNHVRRVEPEIFAARAEQSRKIGCRLVRVKGKRLFLDELHPDAKGRKMKSVECGIFCDTR